MNSVQMHLALTHVPVILSLVGLMMLIVAFMVKNPTLTTTSYVLIVIAGIAAIPVFLTGEGTEEAVENLAGLSEGVIERHEEVAKIAMMSISAAAVMAGAALISLKWELAPRLFKVGTMILTLASAGLLVQTAHLGGQVRHTEISGDIVQNGNEDVEQGKDNVRQEYQQEQEND